MTATDRAVPSVEYRQAVERDYIDKLKIADATLLENIEKLFEEKALSMTRSIEVNDWITTHNYTKKFWYKVGIYGSLCLDRLNTKTLSVKWRHELRLRLDSQSSPHGGEETMEKSVNGDHSLDSLDDVTIKRLQEAWTKSLDTAVYEKMLARIFEHRKYFVANRARRFDQQSAREDRMVLERILQYNEIYHVRIAKEISEDPEFVQIDYDATTQLKNEKLKTGVDKRLEEQLNNMNKCCEKFASVDSRFIAMLDNVNFDLDYDQLLYKLTCFVA